MLYILNYHWHSRYSIYIQSLLSLLVCGLQEPFQMLSGHLELRLEFHLEFRKLLVSIHFG